MTLDSALEQIELITDPHALIICKEITRQLLIQLDKPSYRDGYKDGYRDGCTSHKCNTTQMHIDAIPILISFVLEMQQVSTVSSRAYKVMAEWDKARNLQGV